VSIYYVIYADTNDFGVRSANATLSTARSGGTLTLEGTSSATNSVGEAQNASAGNWVVSQFFLSFDTSAVSGTITKADITFGTSGTNFSTGSAPSGTQTIEAAHYSWLSAATSQFRSTTALGSLTVLGEGSMAAATDSVNTIVGTTFSGITATSALKFVLYRKEQRTSGASWTASMAWKQAKTADESGTTNDPVLVIAAGTAWEFVGVGSVVEVTGTSHALTEPAGVASGDLLVACISSRIASTTPVTLPSGGEWTLVDQQNNNNTATNTSATPTGTMAYCIRGGSAPNLTFTHPTAPSVAIGRIVAYRNAAQTSTLDHNGSATSGTNVTAINVAAGVTTTQDDDLLVCMRAGGQESTLTALAAATDPTTSSGTGSSVTSNPAPNAWLERADTNTTTGADTALSIYDAVKTAAGSTGNITATASAASAHVVITGAFKIVAATNKSIDADAGSYSVTGTNATFDRTYVLDADTGSYTVSGTDAALSKGLTVGADAGSYAVSGTDAGLEHDKQVTADAGSYSVSGTDAGLYYGFVVSADAGSYSVSGTDATFDRSYAIDADAGSYSVSGTDADPLHGWVLSADAGSYAVSGTDADLFITPAGAIQLDADAGSYAVTGFDVTFDRTYVLDTDAGSYAVTGQDATFNRTHQLIADSGAYAVTGSDADLIHLQANTLDADAGSYAVSGDDVDLLLDRLIIAGDGSYVITGDDADLVYDPGGSGSGVEEWIIQTNRRRNSPHRRI
jgi:hypothetical protein